MAYVMIHGKGLAGYTQRISYDPRIAEARAKAVEAQNLRLANLVINRAIAIGPTPEETAELYRRGLADGLGRAPGSVGARSPPSGIFSGEPGMQRGMRDGLGPHFFATITPGTRGGIFRDFRTQRVGGLSGLGAITSGAKVESGLTQLVSSARSATDNVVNSVSALSRTAAEQWAASIVNTTLDLQAQLLAKKDGKPFYARHPDVAAKLTQDIQNFVVQETAEFADSANSFGVARGVGNLLSSIFAAILAALEEIIKGLAETAGKFPVGTVALIGGAALLLYLKFAR